MSRYDSGMSRDEIWGELSRDEQPMSEIPDALVEKGAEAAWLGTIHGQAGVVFKNMPETVRATYHDFARAVLTAVWPDVSAARLVVDRESLMQAVTVGCGSAEGVRHPSLRIEKIADAILASGAVQDAADVRRAVAAERSLT